MRITSTEGAPIFLVVNKCPGENIGDTRLLECESWRYPEEKPGRLGKELFEDVEMRGAAGKVVYFKNHSRPAGLYTLVIRTVTMATIDTYGIHPYLPLTRRQPYHHLVYLPTEE